MVEKYTISSSAALVGSILYDDSARLVWKFGDATNLDSTVYMIEQLRRRRRGSNLKKALEVARDELFGLENGARRNVPKTLVLFVDKNPEGELLPIVAKELKNSGVRIVVVAVGTQVDPVLVEGLASGDKDVVTTPDLSKTINETLKTVLLRSKPGKFRNKIFKCFSFKVNVG